MRKTFLVLVAVAIAITAAPALAELQNITVGGEIRIRGNYTNNVFESPNNLGAAGAFPGFLPVETRWPAGNVNWLPARPIGNFILAPGNNAAGILSPYRWDDKGESISFVEQRTRLNVQADFSDNVMAYIELDSYDIWGEDFRSNYITGADFITQTSDDVEIFQAYIEADEMWDLPLRLRVGRQELSFGSEWLVGDGTKGPLFYGLSFDAIRLTYCPMDTLTIDAWWAKLAENFQAEEDGDVNFYGIYASYTGLENIVLDAYWLLVRDARSLNDTNFIWPVEWIEDAIGVDDYNVTNLHTIGLRGAGTVGALDFEAEVAYQMGNAGQQGFAFKPFLYGDDDAEFEAWGANLMVGYSLDMVWNPRIWVRGAYFGGEDNRDISFWEWLSPFDMPEASVSFNRLFSDVIYSGYVDLNCDFSNGYLATLGIDVNPTESLMATLCVTHFWADETFDSPRYFTLGKYRIPIAPALSFWTDSSDDSLGTEIALFLTYHYTEDLMFQLGLTYFLADDGVGDGNYVANNGLIFNGGSDDDDGIYLYLETCLKF